MTRGAWLAVIVALAACGSPPSGISIDAAPPDASVDAAPPDAMLTPLGPALGIDTVQLTGRSIIFALLGSTILNQQIADLIDSGQLLLVLELRDLDDPAGQADSSLSIGFYSATDPDGDPTDNFRPADPEILIAAPFSLGPDGGPALAFDDASITAGRLRAEGSSLLPLPGSIQLPLTDAVLEGKLVAAPDGLSIHVLEDATLSGTVPASALGAVPNLLSTTCPGGNFLDLLFSGCGLLAGSQPDVDVDGDGFETFADTDQDSVIDRCVDGDGTIIDGTDCWSDSRIADGYELVLSIHATRVRLVVQQ